MAGRGGGAHRAASLLLLVLVGLLLLPPAATAAAPPPAAAGTVVVLGVPGLTWDAVTPDRMPRLSAALDDAGVGALSVRTTRSRTCPAEGWATVGAGQRAVATVPVAVPCVDETLPPPPEPAADGDGLLLPQRDELRAANDDLSYGTVPGRLGTAVQAAGGCTSAVGPAAALAAADVDGELSAYAADVDVLDDAALARLLSCALAAVEVDALRQPVDGDAGDAPSADGSPDPSDVAALAEADAAVGRVLDLAPDGATVLVAGLADLGPVPELHVAVELGPETPGGLLRSRSTRQPGLVQLVDVAPTVLQRLGIPPVEGMVGAAWSVRPGAGGAAARVAELRDDAAAAQAHRQVTASFFVFLLLGQLVLYVGAAGTLRGRSAGDRRGVLRALRLAALTGAAVPVGGFLAMLVPWWRTDVPLLALVGLDLLAALLVAGLALAGPWRRSVLGPVGVVGAVTALVLAADVATGSRLQLNSPTGYSGLVAGRFYGFGNVAFAIFATGLLLALAALASAVLRAGGGRRLAAAAVAVLGAAGVALTGLPSAGADFGGVLALVPGVALLTLHVLGARLTLVRALVVGAVAVAAVAVVSTVDYLRPPTERTHLGRFVGDVLAGEAGEVVRRKAAANVEILLSSTLTLLLPAAVLFVALVLLRPTRWGTPALRSAFERAPLLRSALLAVLATAVVGFAVNDSGVVVPATALMVAVPAATAAAVASLSRPPGREDRSHPVEDAPPVTATSA